MIKSQIANAVAQSMFETARSMSCQITFNVLGKWTPQCRTLIEGMQEHLQTLVYPYGNAIEKNNPLLLSSMDILDQVPILKNSYGSM
jgi:hypothetical protein